MFKEKYLIIPACTLVLIMLFNKTLMASPKFKKCTSSSFNKKLNSYFNHWGSNGSLKSAGLLNHSFRNNKNSFCNQYKIININHAAFTWNANDSLQPLINNFYPVGAIKVGEVNKGMFSSKRINDKMMIADTGIPDSIGVIELRNYILKPGMRDSFTNYFEENFIQSQYALKGYPLGVYKVKGYDDNFFWMRAFKNMKERSVFLPSFYLGPSWQLHKKIPNSMLVNNDNVHLLRPVIMVNDSLSPVSLIKTSLLYSKKGITVIDFFTANTKLQLLKKIFAKSFLPLLKSNGVIDYSLWVCEAGINDFPQLPVFQDKNLLVMISHFKSELDYKESCKRIDSKMTETLRSDLLDAITLRTTLVLYPTKKTINSF